LGRKIALRWLIACQLEAARLRRHSPLTLGTAGDFSS
jgi:hypothetical protein